MRVKRIRPQLLVIPDRETVEQAFQKASSEKSFNLELERNETLFHGEVLMLVAFVRNPLGGTLTVSHVMPGAEEPSVAMLVDAARVLGNTIRIRFQKQVTNGRRRTA